MTHNSVGRVASIALEHELAAPIRLSTDVPMPAHESVRRWQRRYASRLLVTDLVVILISVFGAQFLRFTVLGTQESVAIDRRWPTELAPSYTALSLALALLWMLALQAADTRSARAVGSGFSEYKRIFDSTIWTFGVLAMVDLLLKISAARGYVLIALPLGLVLLLTSRVIWRKWLAHQRHQGHFQYRAIIVGDYTSSRHVAQEIVRDPSASYRIIGSVTTNTQSAPSDAMGIITATQNLTPDAVLTAIDSSGADTLVVTDADTLKPAKMRRLSWELEDRGVELVVAPALTDIAGPRIHTRPVSGLPLIHIAFPVFTGRKYWIKRAFDIAGSAALILLLSPVLITVALAVKLTSPGPVFFSHTRIGQNGQPFSMYKFRSMVPNADAQLAALLAEQGTSDTPLFKIQDDPRITPVGRFIRRYSLDELPQLFNALLGSMSLVGPRPQVEAEVALYDNAAQRRLLVKPGLTGLWQVSGRSNLTWEDSLRLDLYYVENWSLTGDIVILTRTLKAVLASDGAV